MENTQALSFKSSILQRLSSTRMARAALFLIIGMTVAGMGLEIASSITEAGALSLVSFFDFFPLNTLVFSFLGLLILKHHSKHAVGWLFLFIGINSSFNTLVYSFMQFDETVLIGNSDTLLRYITLLGHMIWWPVLILPITLVLLYFPDGKLLSPRWRSLVFVSLLGLLFGMLTAFHSDPWRIWDNLAVQTGIDRFLAGLMVVSAVLILIGSVGSLVSVIIRFRRSEGIERMQMKWLVYGTMISLIFMIILSIISLFLPNGPLFYQVNYIISDVLVLIIPAACGIAIVRHQLWDIDIVINRTLVYGGLSTLIVVTYILIVGGIGILFQTQSNALSGLAAAAIIAVLFQPLRVRLQRSVNRLLYGERDDPVTVLTRLAHHSETAETPTAVLNDLVQTIAHMLKIPYVAIRLPASNGKLEKATFWGEVSDQLQTIPLSFQNESIGELVVATRGPQEQFNQDEEDLLETIAALTATTVRAMHVSDELRHSRQRIISAREEERRRMRRDLHDGLGPQLASQVLGLEAVAQHMPTDPQKAQSLLGSLKAQAKEAILDVRRLVYDLRPPALDDLGLVGALRQSASRYETGALRFRFEVPAPFPELPAAVETAAYRIAQEAIMNVVRHAEATRCMLHLYCTDANVFVEVRDNGRGLSPNHQAGVGLQAMKERSTELNGEFRFESLPEGGTLVQARLPLEVSGE